MPTRQITRWGTERIGTRPHTVRSPERKFDRVGRPARTSSSSQRTSARLQVDRVGVSRRRVDQRRERTQGVGQLPRLRAAGVHEVGDRRWPGLHPVAAGCVPDIAARTPRSRVTSSASRPTSPTSPLCTSSTGKHPTDRGRPSSDIATPSSRRSRPQAHVPVGTRTWNSARCRHPGPSGPRPSVARPRAAPGRRRRIRTGRAPGGRPAKSSTVESPIRPVTIVSRTARAASTSLDCSGVRSAIRTRSRPTASRPAGRPRPAR